MIHYGKKYNEYSVNLDTNFFNSVPKTNTVNLQSKLNRAIKFPLAQHLAMSTSISNTVINSNLKEDIKLLEKLFLKKPSGLLSSSTSSNRPSTSKDTKLNEKPKFNCFRIITASTDELVCEFIDTALKKYRINANLCVRHFCIGPVETYIF